MNRIMIAGTDTDIGKTHVAASLLARARMDGYRCIGLKPVAAGADYDTEGNPFSDDAARLAAGAGYVGSLEAINPYLFEDPIAPHIACERESVEITADHLVSWARAQAEGYERVLIEGAGGWRVPLNKSESFADIGKGLGWGVVLVVGMRLGCISHALLTAEAILADGLELVGWVANPIEENQAAYAENLQSLIQRLPAPLLGEMPVGQLSLEERAQAVIWPA